MRKSKFVKSTIILMIGGLITKILSTGIRIIMTRMIGVKGIGLYMLISPTFMLLIALANLGLPIAISTLISKKKYYAKNLIFSVFPISSIINIVLFITLFVCSDFIAINLLNEPRVAIALKAIGFVLPFITITSLLRGYYFGKQRMIPHVVSNVVEDIVRLIVIIIGIPIALNYDIEIAVAFLVISNIFSEITAIIVLLIYLPKQIKLTEKLEFNKNYLKDILKISLPATGSRLIGTVGSFFEPIILTTILLSIGYTSDYIITEYGIITGYALPILLLPSFFSLAISQALIPNISEAYELKKYEYCKNKIIQAILFSMIIGVPVTLLLMLFPEVLLNLLYNTSEGSLYLQLMAPIFLIFYIQSPLVSAMQAMNKAKSAMIGTFIGTILKLTTLLILSYMKIGLIPLIIAISINIVFTTVYSAMKIRKYLKKDSI